MSWGTYVAIRNDLASTLSSLSNSGGNKMPSPSLLGEDTLQGPCPWSRNPQVILQLGSTLSRLKEDKKHSTKNDRQGWDGILVGLIVTYYFLTLQGTWCVCFGWSWFLLAIEVWNPQLAASWLQRAETLYGKCQVPQVAKAWPAWLLRKHLPSWLLRQEGGRGRKPTTGRRAPPPSLWLHYAFTF